VRDALGIAIATGAYALSFGAISVTAGLSILQTCALSLLMFTGASQFAFVGVIGAGGSPWAGAATAALLGSRNALYGVRLLEVLKELSGAESMRQLPTLTMFKINMNLEMEGGTIFHFVTEEIEAALDQARAAARDKDVRIGGGAATIRQYLRAGLLDEMHLAISPILLGQGEPLLEGIDLPGLGYRVREHVFTEAAMHLVVGR